MSHGFVYVLSNPSMPGIFKIGMTERSPHLRACELSAATGVAAAFEVLCYAEFAHAYEMEREIHEVLQPFRYSPSREFFAAPFDFVHTCVCEHIEALSQSTSEKAAALKAQYATAKTYRFEDVPQ